MILIEPVSLLRQLHSRCYLFIYLSSRSSLEPPQMTAAAVAIYFNFNLWLQAPHKQRLKDYLRLHFETEVRTYPLCIDFGRLVLQVCKLQVCKSSRV